MQGNLWQTQETPRRVACYAGYSFSMQRAAQAVGIEPRICGIVTTPRWARDVAREFSIDPDEGCTLEGHEAPSMGSSILLDNGAFPAWRRGEPLSMREQLDGIHDAMGVLGMATDWIIAPDVVGDAQTSWDRTISSLPELEQYGLSRLMLAAQDNADLDMLAGLALELQCGVFIGGRDWSFKAHALATLAAYDLPWLHVGRAKTEAELAACARLGAHACDSTSWLRMQHHNVAARPTTRATFDQWAAMRNSPTEDEQPSWPLPQKRAKTLDQILADFTQEQAA